MFVRQLRRSKVLIHNFIDICLQIVLQPWKEAFNLLDRSVISEFIHEDVKICVLNVEVNNCIKFFAYICRQLKAKIVESPFD